MMRRVLLPGVVVMLLAACRSAESSSPAPAPSASSAPSSPAPLMSMADAKSEELVLHVQGLTCEGCAWQIRETLQKVDGVREVRTTVADKRVVVTYDADRVRSQAIRDALEQVGYNSDVVRQ